MLTRGDLISIGRILKPQGLRGEVKAASDFDGDFKEIFIDGQSEPLRVEKYARRGGFAFIIFSGINDRNAAEKLRGKIMRAPRAALNLKDGERLRGDIIGCRLRDTDGRDYGEITAIDNFGAADVYTVSDGGAEARFPFISALRSAVDAAAKTMTVDAAALAAVLVTD